MASKELVKKEKETAVSPFVVFQTAIAEIREAVTANLGDRALGHPDPGAVSMSHLLEGFAEGTPTPFPPP